MKKHEKKMNLLVVLINALQYSELVHKYNDLTLISNYKHRQM